MHGLERVRPLNQQWKPEVDSGIYSDLIGYYKNLVNCDNFTINTRMDPIGNPYAPGAGTPPPELAGRDELREIVRIALERVRAGVRPRAF